MACGVVILILALKDRDELETLINHRWTIAALPLSLSFDNLLIGVSLGTFGYPLPLAAATIGGISACMCLFGIAGGMRIRRWIPGARQRRQRALSHRHRRHDVGRPRG